MLKFFRKIRRRLLQKGKLKNYLVYSIGEIVLVVIGILIALQINNWNEERQERKAELNALRELKVEFLANKRLFNETISIKRAARNGWKTFLQRLAENKFEAIEQNVLGSWSSGSRTTNLKSTTLKAIMDSGRIERIRNDSLKNLLSSWENIFDEYQEEEIFHRNFDQNQFRPAERKLFSIPKFDYPIERDPLLYKSLTTEAEFKEAYRNALMDREYRNLLMANHSLLAVQVDEGLLVEQTIDQILRWLEEEIALKEQ